MKQNELQDFNNLPDEWTITTLGKVLPILYGKGLTKDKRDEEGPYPVFGSSGQVGKHSESLIKKPALIIGRKGSVGEVYYSLVPCWPIDTTYYVEETEDLYLRFFEYLLKGLNLGKLDKSTAIPSLSRDDYNVVQVAIAPLDQQKLIVAEIEKQFSRLDEAMAALKRIQANLKRYKASVLKAAVEGKLTEEWRSRRGTLQRAPTKDETGADLLKRILIERRRIWEEDYIKKHVGAHGYAPKDDSWKKKYIEPPAPETSNLPELPKGWAWVFLECVAEVIDPQPSHRTPPEVKAGIPYIGMGDIDKYGDIDFDRARKVSKKILDEHRNRYKLEVGDFIFGKIGTIGKPVKLFPPFKYTISANVVLIQPQRSIISPAFCFSYIDSPLMDLVIRKESRATTQAAFGIQKVRIIPIPLPPVREQQAIINEIEQRLSVAEEIATSIEMNLKGADRLRQSILKKAFSGKLV